MEDITYKAILVSGIESGENKITLLEKTEGRQYPTKYSFFINKQDGSQSKAYQQFEALGVGIGKVYEIAYKESKGTNQMSGKEVTYRNIMFFKDGTRIAPEAKNGATLNDKPEVVHPAIMEGINLNTRKIVAEIEALKRRVEILEGLSLETNPVAHELHESLHDYAKKPGIVTEGL